MEQEFTETVNFEELLSNETLMKEYVKSIKNNKTQHYYRIVYKREEYCIGYYKGIFVEPTKKLVSSNASEMAEILNAKLEEC